MVIGIIGGFCLLFTQWFVLKVKVDDPLDATAGIIFKYIVIYCITVVKNKF